GERDVEKPYAAVAAALRAGHLGGMGLLDRAVPGVDLGQQLLILVHYFFDRKMVQIFSRIFLEPASTSGPWRTIVSRSWVRRFCVSWVRAARISLIVCAIGGFSCSSTPNVSRSRQSSSLSSSATQVEVRASPVRSDISPK